MRPDYTSIVAGVGKTLFKGVQVDALYYGSNKSKLGENYEDRIVISTKMLL